MSDFEGRELFIVTIVVEDPPPKNGQHPNALNIPAFVKNWQTAAEKAEDYIKNFPNTPEAKQVMETLRAQGFSGEPKLKLRVIQTGGTILI